MWVVLPAGQRASYCGDAVGTKAVLVPACPRSRLTSPCFLILMTINRFLSVSALLLQGRDRKREKRARESEQASKQDSEGPLIENSWQLIRGKGDPVYCTDRVGMCGQMMMTGSMTTLPLSVPAKTHHHWLTDCLPAYWLTLFSRKNTGFGILFHDCAFTVCYI